MKPKLLKILTSKVFQIGTAFFVGGISTYFVTDYMRLKNQVSQTVTPKENKLTTNLSQKDPFTSMTDIHDQMRKRMDKMFNSDMFGSSLLGNSFFDSHSFGSFSDSDVQVDEYEDDKFKYVTIQADGIDKDAIQINISDGMISISGKIKKSNESNGSNGSNAYSSSSYISSFSKSFNVPYGVDADKVKIENEKSKIVIKFPKSTV